MLRYPGGYRGATQAGEPLNRVLCTEYGVLHTDTPAEMDVSGMWGVCDGIHLK